MPKYIKDKTGKFAGSIGDGKTATPEAPPNTRNIPTEALLRAFEESPNGTVKLSDLLTAHEEHATVDAEAPKSASEKIFGGHAALGDSDLSKDPIAWGKNLTDLIDDSSEENFSSFIEESDNYPNGYDEHHYMIHDSRDSTAYLVYRKSMDEAWVETYTSATKQTFVGAGIHNRFLKHVRT